MSCGKKQIAFLCVQFFLGAVYYKNIFLHFFPSTDFVVVGILF